VQNHRTQHLSEFEHRSVWATRPDVVSHNPGTRPPRCAACIRPALRPAAP
jgi:hypothetical protein